MLKTLLVLCGAALLTAPSLHAQRARSFGGGGGRSAASSGVSHATSSRGYGGYHGGYRGGYRGGHGYYGGRGYYSRRFYLGGIGYDYPFFGYGYGLGFGYPAYAYSGYWNGYGGAPYGYGYGSENVYEGRLANDSSSDHQQGASLPTAVQRQLAKRGYYKGTADGNFGPASRSALSRFQRDNDLKETGRIDEDTLEALGFSDHR